MRSHETSASFLSSRPTLLIRSPSQPVDDWAQGPTSTPPPCTRSPCLPSEPSGAAVPFPIYSSSTGLPFLQTDFLPRSHLSSKALARPHCPTRPTALSPSPCFCLTSPFMCICAARVSCQSRASICLPTRVCSCLLGFYTPIKILLIRAS